MACGEGGGPMDLDAEAGQLLAEVARTKPRRRVLPRLAEPLQNAEDRQIESSVGGLTAWRLGQGPAVLLVHGWEDDNALWGPMIDRLQANGRPIVAFDLPGHGFSPADLESPSAAGAAVRAVADAFGPIEAVVGHSFGCVALTMALADGLQVERAVLIASPIPKNRTKVLERLREMDAPPAVAARAAELLAASEVQTTPFDIEAAASLLSMKALIIHSMDDDSCPPENARLIADVWRGSTLMWVDGLGHRRVAQDAAITQKVADFVDGFD